MEKPVKGNVVVVKFPFSDLSYAKRRPAFVVSSLKGDDLILCQITSKFTKDKYSIQLVEKDFESGGLGKESNVRAGKLFTADKSIILYKLGSISKKKIKEIEKGICKLIKD